MSPWLPKKTLEQGKKTLRVTALQQAVNPRQRNVNDALFRSTADLHRQLQSPWQQRREEPVGTATVPLQRNLQEQRGGRHGPVKPHTVQAGRKA